MPNTAIKVSHLTKVYKLYDKPVDRLGGSLHPLKKQYHKDFYILNCAIVYPVTEYFKVLQ